MKQETPLGEHYKKRVESGWGDPPVKPDYVLQQEQLDWVEQYGVDTENFRKYTKK